MANRRSLMYRLCHIKMVVIKVFHPTSPNQILIALLLQFLIWLTYQFKLSPLMFLKDSFQRCLSSRIMSIRLNRSVFLYIKFVSGGLSTPEVIWIFDPGINKQIFSIEGIGACGKFIFVRTRSGDCDVVALSRSNYSGSMEKEIMVINQQRWAGRYKRCDRKPFQPIFQSVCLIIVMRKIFGSFIHKMLAFYEYMKRGLNRCHILPVRLPFGKQDYFRFFIKIVFNFLYLV
ncbi:hypothetical protein ARALYDRAFT_909938 [Arabidopsis lyrata subsp. lyrata]|uniref:Uncharacterized protein n=1 Tax=Arabidopsis lyrata subsp. lyrata TaxID=81972 RepID=D7LYL4_ARALL|nr:hypothetical protein ARALYDRAFT_909938 [Arabidopsis lyrata subsp. lyrata]